MPELPEVETSRRGVSPYVADQRITAVIVRDRRLRWPVANDVEKNLTGARIEQVGRRAKYLLFDTGKGSAMLHLGMSGSIRVIDQGEPAGKHDHVDICLENGHALRFRDPRRFGSLLWADNPAEHPLIRDLGPEPLSDAFDGDYLYRQSRGRRISIKPFIMNPHVVVGVGNIYASESLFLSGIHPKRAAGRVAKSRLDGLTGAIKSVLKKAIRAGGTTLRDFYGGDGEPGYFKQKLEVYDRADQPCRRCASPIKCVVLGQRASYYCKSCQR